MQENESVYDELNRVNDELRHTKQASKWIRLDRTFHHSLVSATGLGPLSAFNEIVHLFFDRFRNDFPRDHWSGGVEAHQRVIDYLQADRPDQAASELREHIESHRARLKETERTSD